MDIMESWKFKSPARDAQITALHWLQDNINKKYFFCELPVGTGKSLIGVTFGDYLHQLNPKLKASFILTPQKVLQNQYERAFTTADEAYFATIYGSNHYSCNRLKGLTCESGKLIKAKCQDCPSKNAINKAVNANHTVLNYTLAMIDFQCNKEKYKSPRNLMVFDECHSIEDLLTDHHNIEITKANCLLYGLKMPTDRSLSNVYEWVHSQYLPEVDAMVDQLKYETRPYENMDAKHMPIEAITQLKKLNDLEGHMALVNNFVHIDIDEVETHFIVTGDNDTIKLKYVFGNINFNEIFEPKADKFLFLSATIFDYKEMCKNLGIPLEEACFISLPSEFADENRTVLYSPTMKMNYGWQNRTSEKQKMADIIKGILKEHHDEKGVIHTGNYEISKWIVDELKREKHLVFHHNPGSGRKRDNVINEFIDSTRPAVLVSPSVCEGLDLADDSARFIIFAKISFGSLADNWIKKRMELSKSWYSIRALTSVLQGQGRGVRHSNDYCVTYILDESFGFLYNSMSAHIPKWWKSAFHKI